MKRRSSYSLKTLFIALTVISVLIAIVVRVSDPIRRRAHALHLLCAKGAVITFRGSDSAAFGSHVSTGDVWRDVRTIKLDGVVVDQPVIDAISQLGNDFHLDCRGLKDGALPLGRALGKGGFAGVELTESSLAPDILTAMPRQGAIGTVKLRRTIVSDQDLSRLALYRGLWQVDVAESEVTGECFSSRGWDELEVLNVGHCPLSKDGVVAISKLPALRVLDCSECTMQDNMLKALSQSRSLEMLIFNGTKVSPDALDRFRSARPLVKVVD